MKQFYPILLLICFILQSSSRASSQSNHADCSTALVLCDKSPLIIHDLAGYGNQSEIPIGSCFQKDFVETNSIWLKWKTAEAGNLTFTILPLNEDDDIDFALYKGKNLAQCAFYEPLRCMAAGPYLGNEHEFRQGCTGTTGLRIGAGGNSKSSGCTKDAENFLSPIEMISGEYYTLFINNFRSTGGVLIEWGGTATFQPIPTQCALSLDLSNTLTLQNGNEIQFSDPFPNPTSDRVNITAISSKEHDGQIQIIGSDGQLELSLPCVITPGSNLIALPTEDLRTGVHFIKLRTIAETHLLRFVKH